ncbi:unnamed protein product [Durusdinium trenchii]|uniref:Uncharacterized protein n=1 Tax=Durusdinium trenchii TaxID=1381693 RepID=A0ABP0NVC6_9DINO
MAMLWIEVKSFLPFYALIYILPQAFEVGPRALKEPVLLLGLDKRAGCSLAWVLRVIATFLCLALTAWMTMMPDECLMEIWYALGVAPVKAWAFQKWTKWMVGGTPKLPPLLNLAASQNACPSTNTMDPLMYRCYFGFLGFVWVRRSWRCWEWEEQL